MVIVSVTASPTRLLPASLRLARAPRPVRSLLPRPFWFYALPTPRSACVLNRPTSAPSLLQRWRFFFRCSVLASSFAASMLGWPLVDPDPLNRSVEPNWLSLIRSSSCENRSPPIRFGSCPSRRCPTSPSLGLLLPVGSIFRVFCVAAACSGFLLPLVSPYVGSSLSGVASSFFAFALYGIGFFSFASSPPQLRHVEMLNTKHFSEVLQLVRSEWFGKDIGYLMICLNIPKFVFTT